MTKINVTRLITENDPFDFSASIAERGKNAGPETWANAKTAATDQPLNISDRDEVRGYFAGFGAWDRDEIAAWSDSDVDALVLQYAAGDLRELQSLCPGDGLGDIDWTEAESLAHAGSVGGNLYANGDQLFINLSN